MSGRRGSSISLSWISNPYSSCASRTGSLCPSCSGDGSSSEDSLSSSSVLLSFTCSCEALVCILDVDAAEASWASCNADVDATGDVDVACLGTGSSTSCGDEVLAVPTLDLLLE